MKRELKEFFKRDADFPDRVVARLIPMKRELKAVAVDQRDG